MHYNKFFLKNFDFLIGQPIKLMLNLLDLITLEGSTKSKSTKERKTKKKKNASSNKIGVLSFKVNFFTENILFN